MEKKLIKSCMQDNQIFKVGDYVMIKDSYIKAQNNYNFTNEKKVKILNLSFESSSSLDNVQFKALVEGNSGICDEVNVSNLKSIKNKKENSITKSCKAYETLKGELKFFITNTDKFGYNNI